jgi:pyrroloquinoline quinone biosynthesis protein B
MRIRILGSAAGGRFPQWNCGCGNCIAVRDQTHKNVPGNQSVFKPRTQAQLALSADGSTWFLAGASPDLAFQIENCTDLHPRVPRDIRRDTRRDSPISGVVLGSCDLDHVVGLLLLRELQPLRVYAAASILRILREENSMFGMLNRVEPQVVWTAMTADAPFPLLSAEGKDSGLRCEVHYLSGRYPKYVKTEIGKLGRDEATAALFFQTESDSKSEPAAAKRVAYVPAIGSLSDTLLEKISRADLLLFDGTFWSDDELRRVQGDGETAHEMGHIPVEESLRLLKEITINVGRKMFIHLNNTNPILNEASPERRAVRQAGWEVAEDNWQLEL